MAGLFRLVKALFLSYAPCMFIARFLKYLQFEKRFSAHTIAAYQNDLSQFESYLQQFDLDFSQASHFNIRSWMVDLVEKNAKPKTIHRKISSLRSFYKFLIREQLLQDNPSLRIKVPKAAKRLPIFVEEQRMEQLLNDQNVFGDDFSGRRDRAILELLYGTGMRLAELVNLQEVDLDLQQAQLKVLGKRNKERIIPIHASLLRVMTDYLLAKKEQCFIGNNSSGLIVNNAGTKIYPKFIYRVVKKYLSLVFTNEKRGPHTLRHTFATALLNRGADLNAIKELLGHASLSATQVYTHNSVERLKLIYKQAHPKA